MPLWTLGGSIPAAALWPQTLSFSGALVTLRVPAHFLETGLSLSTRAAREDLSALPMPSSHLIISSRYAARIPP